MLRRSHPFSSSISHFLSLLLLLVLLLLLGFAVALNQEGLYLLRFKGGVDDPNGCLANWNSRDATPCQWKGVSCSADGSVASLALVNCNLRGPFHPVLCRLSSLSYISLTLNYINGTLPDDALSPCSALVHLDLSENVLVGTLPSALASLPQLRHLDLSFNNFSGPIPPAFGRFPRLENLTLISNFLNGTIPGFLGQVTSLQQLNLSYNPFTPGRIPPEIGNLISLRQLWLTQCNLVGAIPPSLGNLRNLLNLDVSSNGLDGRIPESLAELSSAVQIELYNNSLIGEIPTGLANLSSLRRIDASLNHLEGTIPAGFFDLPLIESLCFHENRLVGGLPASVAKAEKLSDLRLFHNQLNGSIPADLGKKSPLQLLDLSENLFTGEIPRGICDQGALEQLMLLGNSLSGTMPDGLARCRALQRVRLGGNLLSGEVPSGMWGLPHLSLLDLRGNSLSGGISPTVSGAGNISNLIISNNQFTGSIPAEVGTLHNLHVLSADNNRLTGPLPLAIGSLPLLEKLDLRNNSISGELPMEIPGWRTLSELNLAYNELTGNIPPALGSLPVLNYLDLSNNLLTGEVPRELQNLKLNRLNLSNNQLSGDLPPLYASETYRDSFFGNPGLCRDVAGLCPGSQEGVRKSQGYLWLLRSIFILAALVLVVGVGCFYCRYRKFRKAKSAADKSKWTLTSFHKLGFKEDEILDCLEEDNLIGSGGSGKVYKAVLSNGEPVAVKKLWGSSGKGGQYGSLENAAVSDAFEAEIATLGKIRHKNIVKLWCCCTHQDSRLLVYEFMPNGSLGDLLHSSKAGLLDWPTRYKIALDAAEGLSYLHHDCAPPIVHRDVKSNNILLDAHFGARVADFGVAKAVEAGGKGLQSMSVIAGSCGYIAPEYAYTLRVNEKSDIYSFGVVLLELVTGKPPVDPEFEEKDLVKWVCSTLVQKGLDHLLDPKLDSCFREEIFKVLNIALLCTSNLPINRPPMRRVVKMLLEVGGADNSKPKPEKKDGQQSPYYCGDASGGV